MVAPGMIVRGDPVYSPSVLSLKLTFDVDTSALDAEFAKLKKHDAK
jgi:hypothetical protein